jgi:bacterioferritin-associated ferredoxin
MYVCICNAVTEREIAHVVQEEGVMRLEQLQECLLVGTCCGKCRDKADECLQKYRPQRPVLVALSA